MIRRQVGHEWWLFAQEDHAQLAGDFAAELGGTTTPLSETAIQAVRRHDAGWITEDAAPELNAQRQPNDVFETPLDRGLDIWRRSSVLAHEELDPYAALLVSCHSLALSAFAAGRTLGQSQERSADMRLHFLLNKFQHAEIELQERLRQQLGMRLDAPLTLGLATESIEPREQQLIFDYRWLAAMDQVSLNVCCSTVMFPTLTHTQPAVGQSEMQLHVSRVDLGRACVRPWPFAGDSVRTSIAFRRLPAAEFANKRTLHDTIATAAVERMPVELIPAGPLAATA